MRLCYLGQSFRPRIKPKVFKQKKNDILQIRISTEQKSNWEEVTKIHRIDLSELIRSSTQRTISQLEKRISVDKKPLSQKQYEQMIDRENYQAHLKWKAKEEEKHEKWSQERMAKGLPPELTREELFEKLRPCRSVLRPPTV